MEDYLKTEDMVQALKGAGCSQGFVDIFMKAQGNIPMQLRMLQEQRDRMLKRLHTEEKRLDCLDFLRYKLQKISGKGSAG